MLLKHLVVIIGGRAWTCILKDVGVVLEKVSQAIPRFNHIAARSRKVPYQAIVFTKQIERYGNNMVISSSPKTLFRLWRFQVDQLRNP